MNPSKVFLSLVLVMMLALVGCSNAPEKETRMPTAKREVRPTKVAVPTEMPTEVETPSPTEEVVATKELTVPVPTLNDRELAAIEAVITRSMDGAVIRPVCAFSDDTSAWAQDVASLGFLADLSVIREWRNKWGLGQICGLNVTQVYADQYDADMAFWDYTHYIEKGYGDLEYYDEFFYPYGRSFSSRIRCEPNGWCTTMNVMSVNQSWLGRNRNLLVVTMIGSRGYAPGTLTPSSQEEMRVYWDSYIEAVIQGIADLGSFPENPAK